MKRKFFIDAETMLSAINPKNERERKLSSFICDLLISKQLLILPSVKNEIIGALKKKNDPYTTLFEQNLPLTEDWSNKKAIFQASKTLGNLFIKISRGDKYLEQQHILDTTANLMHKYSNSLVEDQVSTNNSYAEAIKFLITTPKTELTQEDIEKKTKEIEAFISVEKGKEMGDLECIFACIQNSETTTILSSSKDIQNICEILNNTLPKKIKIRNSEDLVKITDTPQKSRNNIINLLKKENASDNNKNKTTFKI